MEETPEAELISPRISFSHDLVVVATPPPAASLPGRRSDVSLLLSRSSSIPAEPEFDFAVAAADDDAAPADRLFAGGKLLPMPPLPPAARKPTSPCKPQQACRVKAQQQACQQIRQSGSSWASPFSRSSSVNSATTTTTGGPRSAGKFGCRPFPLMRSWSVGSAAAVARDGAAVTDAAAGHRPHHHHQYYKKFGGAAAAASNGGGGGSRAYYYGGSRKGSSGGGSHGGVRVRPVLNVSFIGTSVSNVLSYLLCDCSSHSRTKKSSEFI